MHVKRESDRGIANNGNIGINGRNGNTGGNPDIAAMIALQLQDLLPTIVMKSNNGANNQGNGNGVVKGVQWQRWRVSIQSMGREDGISNRYEQLCNQPEGEARGRAAAVGMAWDDFKTLLREEYCPHNEMEKLENEFWNHTMVGAGHATYRDRFHELANLVPHLVTPEFKRIDRYIYCLVPEINGMVRKTKPSTIQSAILKAGGLTDDAVRNGLLNKGSEKRKDGGETSKQEDVKGKNKRARTEKGFMATDSDKKEYKDPHPKCAKCNYHHQETTSCGTCFNCNQPGMLQGIVRQ
ncbi:reverse transcriptase domain-containing protein [Tanacetum coccineum]|uniref:Reverse transcriptase domain-containing protein n=1 Tax=Tanacetum coccineum TaxID=301880 RepID=A0ABQ5HN76_9ASTR